MVAWLLLLACAGDSSTEGHNPLPPKRPGPAAGTEAKAFFASPTFQLSPAEGDRRSVLLISLDTVRADRLGVYGGRAQTPNLSSFAAEGARYDQAMTHFPETCLSHWSMLSGVMPAVHGNVPAQGGSIYTGPTGAEIARKAGYRTAAFIGGRTLQDTFCGLSRGFDYFDDKIPSRPDVNDRPAKEVLDAALRWMTAQTGPTFVFVHLFDAHTPYEPKPAFDVYGDRSLPFDGSARTLAPFLQGEATPTPAQVERALSLYDAELSGLDAELGTFLAKIPHDTVVAITSDHGESFEHGYYFNHQLGLWDSVMRVPLLLRGPGVPAGTQIAAQVGHIDLLPTLLDLAGLPADQRMMGQSTTPLLRGEGQGRAEVFATTDPWLPQSRFALRTPTHKALYLPDEAQGFDLLADPGETEPLDIPEALAGGRAAYEALIAGHAPHQVAPPASRSLGQEERNQLEALGYIDPPPPQPPRPSPPPPGPRPPPRPPSP